MSYSTKYFPFLFSSYWCFVKAKKLMEGSRGHNIVLHRCLKITCLRWQQGWCLEEVCVLWCPHLSQLRNKKCSFHSSFPSLPMLRKYQLFLSFFSLFFPLLLWRSLQLQEPALSPAAAARASSRQLVSPPLPASQSALRCSMLKWNGHVGDFEREGERERERDGEGCWCL